MSLLKQVCDLQAKAKELRDASKNIVMPSIDDPTRCDLIKALVVALDKQSLQSMRTIVALCERDSAREAVDDTPERIATSMRSALDAVPAETALGNLLRRRARKMRATLVESGAAAAAIVRKSADEVSPDNRAVRRLAVHCRALEALALHERDCVEPLLVSARARFAFHFGGDRPTNRDDKPEWVFAHVRSELRAHAPLLRALRLVGDARLALLGGLVQLAVERVSSSIARHGVSLHVVTETVAFEDELVRVHHYTAPTPQPSDALAAHRRAWHQLEYELIERAWNDAETSLLAAADTTWLVADADDASSSGKGSDNSAPLALLQAMASATSRASQLCSTQRRDALLVASVVRAAATARESLRACASVRALDDTLCIATALADVALSPAFAGGDLLAAELLAWDNARHAIQHTLVDQSILAPFVYALRTTLHTDLSTMPDALFDLNGKLAYVKAVARDGATLRNVVLEVCAMIDRRLFDALWSRPQMPSRRVMSSLDSLMTLVHGFTAPLSPQSALPKLADLQTLTRLTLRQRSQLIETLARVSESAAKQELRDTGVNSLIVDIPKVLVILKQKK